MVFALFVLVLYALICFGMILATKSSLTHAASEGARAAISVVDNPATPADERESKALEKVASGLDWLGSKFQPGDATASVDPCDAAVPSGPQCITVTIVYPYESRPIVPPAPGLGLVTPKKLTSTAVVELT